MGDFTEEIKEIERACIGFSNKRLSLDDITSIAQRLFERVAYNNSPVADRDLIGRIEALESYNKERKLIKEAKRRFKEAAKFDDKYSCDDKFARLYNIPRDGSYLSWRAEALKILQESE